MQTYRHKHRLGISLMEVLISIFVISVGLLGLASLLPLAHIQASRGTRADRAAILGKVAVREFKVREMANPATWLTSANAAVDPTTTPAVCIDPLGIAANITGNFPSGGTMPRISLWNGVSPTSPARMAKAQAEEVFIAQDDLMFEIPTDVTQAPIQQLAGKRLSDGNYSWLATLARETGGDRYTLSVVVVHQRNFAAGSETTAALEFQGGGLSGGSAQITGAVDVKVGHWIMVSSGALFKWYRITHVGQAAGNTLVTLNGQDWAGGLTGNTATILPGIVGVYERTIRLEASTLYQR